MKTLKNKVIFLNVSLDVFLELLNNYCVLTLI